MPESRDRLSRPEDITELFVRRRSSILGVLDDESERNSDLFDSPSRRESMTTTTTVGARGASGILATRAGRVGRGGFGTPRIGSGRGHGRGRALYRLPLFGRENTPAIGSGRRGRGRSGNTVLPSWYPRIPLRDITHVVRAIERRRSRLRDGQQIDPPIPQDISDVHGPIFPPSSAQLEQDISMITPNPTNGMKLFPKTAGKMPKILLDIADQTDGESDFLTPQKKLLNSIDTVEKAVMEELEKLKRTPTAKQAEQEKRVRTLMSMR